MPLGLNKKTSFAFVNLFEPTLLKAVLFSVTHAEVSSFLYMQLIDQLKRRITADQKTLSGW